MAERLELSRGDICAAYAAAQDRLCQLCSLVRQQVTSYHTQQQTYDSGLHYGRPRALTVRHTAITAMALYISPIYSQADADRAFCGPYCGEAASWLAWNLIAHTGKCSKV